MTKRHINLYKLTWLPLFLMVFFFFLILFSKEYFNNQKISDEVADAVRFQIESQQYSFANEIYLERVQALSQRIDTILNYIGSIYPNTQLCLAVQSDKPAIYFQRCTLEGDLIENYDVERINTIPIRIGGSVVGDYNYLAYLPIRYSEVFSPFLITALLLSIIIVLLLQVYLVNNLKQKALKPLLIELQESAKEHGILQASKKVVHDIRSPLTALELILKESKDIPENKRIILRNVVDSIKSIIGNLLKYSAGKKSESDDEHTHHTSPELIFDLLEIVIAENEAQLSEKAIKLKLIVASDAYGLFAKVDISGFKRIISNLFNNASDAITDKGVIEVRLAKSDNYITINVQDNGCGIPANKIDSIFNEGFTFGKTNGTGMGLAIVADHVKAWGGTYAVSSELNKSTTFTIQLPIIPTPKWFISELLIKRHQTVIVLDDDESIHSVWRERFSEYIDSGLVNLIHVKKEQDVDTQFKHYKDNGLFLVDYELIGFSSNGLNIIKQYGISQNAVLVTSHFEDADLKKQCLENSMKIIPKNYSVHIPIKITHNAPYVVLLDDNLSLTSAWKFQASIKDIELDVYNSPHELLNNIKKYSSDTEFYLDYNLEHEMTGLDVADKLYNLGFTELNISTGEDKLSCEVPEYIKSVRDKNFPL